MLSKKGNWSVDFRFGDMGSRRIVIDCRFNISEFVVVIGFVLKIDEPLRASYRHRNRLKISFINRIKYV